MLGMMFTADSTSKSGSNYEGYPMLNPNDVSIFQGFTIIIIAIAYLKCMII
jgi:hypothetical protein